MYNFMGFSYKIKKECLPLSTLSAVFSSSLGFPFILWPESDLTLCTSMPAPIFGQVAEDKQ